MTGGYAIESNLLRRVLTDSQTGLPSVLYFSLIREWEERRARRRDYRVRVIKVSLSGGGDRIRKTFAWRLCREMRTSDLIASDGPGKYRLLLTSPDAEQAGAVCERLERLGKTLDEIDESDQPFTLRVHLDQERTRAELDPCEPCDFTVLGHSGEVPRLETSEELEQRLSTRRDVEG